MKTLVILVTVLTLYLSAIVVELYDPIDPSLVLVTDPVPIPNSLGQGCWSRNIVPYMFKEHSAFPFREDQLAVIRKEVDKFNNLTCLKWVDVDEMPVESRDYVIFNKTVEGWCRMSRVRNITSATTYIVLTMHTSCIADRVQHMMMHALGFTHEHQRSDRDCFVEVLPSQVNEVNYKIYPQHRWQELYPYDKYSVLHYAVNYRLESLVKITVGYKKKWQTFHSEPLGNKLGVLTPFDISKIKFKFCNGRHFCDLQPKICGRAQDFKHRKNCTSWRFTNASQVLPPY